MSRVLTKWLPEDHDFWQNEGKAVARLNLWISIPCLLLAFAVWMVWSVAWAVSFCRLCSVHWLI